MAAAWTMLAVVLGVVILALFAVALRRGEFDSEAPKYEMLGMTPPPDPTPEPGQRGLGVTDRVVRLGLLGAIFHYAGTMGWTTPAGVILSLGGIWLAVTGATGADPIAGWLRARRSGPGDTS